MMSRPRRTPDLIGLPLLVCVILALAASAHLALPAQEPGPRVLWMWSGSVTAHSAVVKGRLTQPGAEARLVYGRQPDLVDAGTPPRVAADGLGIAAFAIEGLQPASQYFYAIEAGGRRSPIGRFRTFRDGPMSFRVAAASCASTGSRSSVFSTIQALDPNLLIHMGDFHYENISANDPARFLRAYDDVFESRTQSDLYRNVPIAYVWDDHDYGPNDADRTSPSRAASRQVYRDAVPHYPLPAGDTTINQAFTIGRVRFILTDMRSERTPIRAPDDDKKSMLGPAQRVWLLEELAAAAARYPLVVWVSTVPWITREGDPQDGWQPFARERTMIADHIKRVGLGTRIIMLSGDAHMSAMDDGTNSNYASDAAPGEPGFVVVHAAPFDRWTSFKGGPYSHAVSRKRGQFATLDVRDDGEVLTVAITGRSKVPGQVIAGLQLTVTCQGMSCSVTSR